MSLKQLVPLPVRDLLRRPYHRVRHAPRNAYEAVLRWRLARQFDPEGPGVPVPVLEDFTPRCHAQSIPWFRNAWINPDYRNELRHFRSVIAAHPGPCRLLDVGANFGVFSIAAIDAGADDTRVLAVEPSPVAFPILKWHFDRLPADRVAALQVAAGEAHGELQFHMGEEASGMMHCVQAPNVRYETYRVPVRPLDEICAEADFWPTVAKIDVEGFEAEVLRGAVRLLAEARPLIFVEVHGQLLLDRGITVEQTFAPVREAGYRIEAIGVPTELALQEVQQHGQVRRFCCRPDAGAGAPSLAGSLGIDQTH